jgi:hypothetical protein
MNVKAKFRCNSVQDFGPGRPTSVEFMAMYDASTPENERFTKATPSGSLTMTVDNPDVVFRPGRNYYLTFEEEQPAP